MKYANGTIYVGEMVKNLRHGFGVRTFKNSDIVYVG